MRTLPFQLPPPTEDERTNALLVHVLAIFTGFIAPLIFFLVKKDSLFVKFHALQVLIWQGVYMALGILAMITVFVSMFFLLPNESQGGKMAEPPLAFFGVFGFIWLLMMGGALLNLILGIVFAIKANQGEWARYPVIGHLALRGILPRQPIS
jgi:uncharacterized membrane protein